MFARAGGDDDPSLSRLADQVPAARSQEEHDRHHEPPVRPAA